MDLGSVNTDDECNGLQALSPDMSVRVCLCFPRFLSLSRFGKNSFARQFADLRGLAVLVGLFVLVFKVYFCSYNLT